MQIAKIENDQIVQIGHYRELFPNTSFPEIGPSDEFLAAQGCVKVSMWVEHDPETESLEMTQPYLLGGKAYLVSAVPLTEETVNQRIALQQEQAIAQAKAERALAVEKIVVTTASGRQFDGDETSQDRMARTIVAMEGSGVETTFWRLADNDWVQVTSAELKEALRLAGMAQTAVWLI